MVYVHAYVCVYARSGSTERITLVPGQIDYIELIDPIFIHLAYCLLFARSLASRSFPYLSCSSGGSSRPDFVPKCQVAAA